MMELGIITVKFDDPLSNKGFVNPDEEDSEFEEDRYGFKIRKVCRVASTNTDKDKKLGEMRANLVEEFKDIFKGDLKNSHMNMSQAEIVIDPSVKNTHKPATTSKDIPVLYKKTAREMLKFMVDEGIIKEVHEPSAYCSRSIFLPKSDSKSLRLVVDFRTIN